MIEAVTINFQRVRLADIKSVHPGEKGEFPVALVILKDGTLMHARGLSAMRVVEVVHGKHPWKRPQVA